MQAALVIAVVQGNEERKGIVAVVVVVMMIMHPYFVYSMYSTNHTYKPIRVRPVRYHTLKHMHAYRYIMKQSTMY
jgi:hypothetical protein